MILYLIAVATAIIFVSACWGMAYGWHRGWEDAASYYKGDWVRDDG